MTRDTAGDYGLAPDEALVRLIRGGDELALSVLYRRYVMAIYRFLLAQLRDADEAEDITSDTFARMLRGLDGYGGRGSFKNWLYQIARNALRTHQRTARFRPLVSLSPQLVAPAETLDRSAADDDAAVSRALAMLAPLPPRYRRILELRFIDGRSIEDAAALLGISVGNAKVLQHRALRKAALVVEVNADAAR